jgi:hypothetical protein
VVPSALTSAVFVDTFLVDQQIAPLTNDADTALPGPTHNGLHVLQVQTCGGFFEGE